MKKLCLGLVFFVFLNFLVFCDADSQEEIDFLLFQPNSSNQFVNQDKAMVQLDKLAKYLLGKNLTSGQICIYGYAAAARNDIDPTELSKNRALLVLNELQKRGVPKDLFSDPVAYGAVNLWGSNANEETRLPNRRVRIVVEGNVITPNTLKAEVPEAPVPTPAADNTQNTAKPASAAPEPAAKFPWVILLIVIILAILALLLILLSKRRKRSDDTVVQETVPASTPAPAESEPVDIAPIAVPVVIKETTVYLEDEIRFYAYELYLRRCGQSENAVEDWHTSVYEICGKYEADGYETYMENGCWWARKTLS